MEIIMRHSRDPELDSTFFAWGMDVATAGIFRFLLGPRCQEILSSVSRVPGHDMSLEHVVFAESEGELVGMLSGMPTEAMGEVFSVLKKYAGVHILRVVLFAIIGRSLLMSMARHAPGEWYVQAVAVKENVRGAGVGASLLASAESRARACGCTRITLDVDLANVAGLHLYEKLGYKEDWVAKGPKYLGGLQIQRMSKAL